MKPINDYIVERIRIDNIHQSKKDMHMERVFDFLDNKENIKLYKKHFKIRSDLTTIAFNWLGSTVDVYYDTYGDDWLEFWLKFVENDAEDMFQDELMDEYPGKYENDSTDWILFFRDIVNDLK
jgi:hypothetical protein